MKKLLGLLFIVCLIIAIIEELFPYFLVIGLIALAWYEYRRRQKLKEPTAQNTEKPNDWDNF